MPAVATIAPYTLVLREDSDAESPRVTNDNLGKMICFHPRHSLGDEHDHVEEDDFWCELVEKSVPAEAVCSYVIDENPKYVKLQYDKVTDKWNILANIISEWEVMATFDNPLHGQEKIIAASLLYYMDGYSMRKLAETENIILPLYLNDHSGLAMSAASFNDQLDSGHVGWIYVSKKEAAASLLCPADEVEGRAAEVLKAEVSEYDAYLHGDCFGFQLYENGAEVNSCWGFIGRPEELKADIESHLPDACKGVMDGLEYLDSDREVDNYLLLQERKPINLEGDFFMNNSEMPGGFDVRCNLVKDPKNNVMAMASVTLETPMGPFAISDIKVVQGQKGMFVAMPSGKDGRGGFKDICFPTTKEGREQINDAVMGAYNEAIGKWLENRTAGKADIAEERPSAVGKLDAAKQKAAQAPKPEAAAPGRAAVKKPDAR